MKKRIIAILGAVSMLLCSTAMPAFAEALPDDAATTPDVAEPMPPSEEYFEENGLQFTIYTPNPYYSTLNEQYAAVSGVDETAESVTIPAAVQGAPVVSVLYGALCSVSLKEILVADDQENFTTKDGVLFDKKGTTLVAYPLGRTGSYAVPEGTTVIDYYAFSAPEDYDGLTEVTFPESLRSFSAYAFMNQCGLTELVLPEGFQDLRECALYNCKGLKTLHLSRDLRTFFKPCGGCTSLCELTGEPTSFYIMDNVLFSKSNDLELYPAGLTAEKYVMPSNVPTIEEGSFQDNPYLKEVEIPISTVAVKASFWNMPALETLTFPEGVGSIYNVGINCPSLTTVYFPKTLDYVGYGAFRDSKALTDIYYNGRVEQYEKISNVLTNRHIHRDGVTVHYNDEEEYELFFDGDEESGGFTYKLYEDHAELAGFTRTQMTGLNEIVRPLAEVRGLPLTTVDRRAFEHAANCGGIELPDSIRTIEPYAFQNSLIQVNLPDGVEIIGDGAFQNASITSVVIPPSVKKIGKYAFRNSKITALTIAEGITDTGDMTFMDCKHLTDVHLPSTLEKIGNNAFAYDEKLETLWVPKGVTLIGGDAFYASGIRRINLPDTVTEIGSRAFGGCQALKTITLPQNLIAVSDNVFEESGITEITIPASVERIDSGAFCSCESLRRITILNPDCNIFNSEDVICTAVLWPETYDDPVPMPADVVKAFTPLAGNDPTPYGDKPTILHDLTICGYANSTAQLYAKAYNIPFEIYDPEAYEVADAVALQRFLLGAGASGGRRNYDLNGDGEMDVYDLALLKRRLLQM